MAGDLALYAPPTPAELEQTWLLAERIAKTDFVPGPLRGKPEAVLACILAGFELHIGPMQALNSIHMIQGRPTLSAELMVALVRSRGHRLRTLERTTEQATVWGVRADDPDQPEQVTFTIDDAKRADLAKKDTWRQYPAAMLWARAVSALCRTLFADVLHGVSYTPDELSPLDGEWVEVERPGTPSQQSAGAAVPAPAAPAAATHNSTHSEEEVVREEVMREAPDHHEEPGAAARIERHARNGEGPAAPPDTPPSTSMREVLAKLRISTAQAAEALAAGLDDDWADVTPREVLDLDGEDLEVAVEFLREQHQQATAAAP